MFHLFLFETTIFVVGLVVNKGATVSAAHLLSVSGSTGAPDATCAPKRLGQPVWESHPFYKIGVINPRAVNGRFHQLENLVDHFSPEPLLLSCLPDHGPLRQRVAFQITPQIDHQSPRHGHNADPPHARAPGSKSLLVPLTQPTVGLQP